MKTLAEVRASGALCQGMRFQHREHGGIVTCYMMVGDGEERFVFVAEEQCAVFGRLFETEFVLIEEENAFQTKRKAFLEELATKTHEKRLKERFVELYNNVRGSN